MTTNEKIVNLAEDNPILKDLLKEKFPEAFDDGLRPLKIEDYMIIGISPFWVAKIVQDDMSSIPKNLVGKAVAFQSDVIDVDVKVYGEYTVVIPRKKK